MGRRRIKNPGLPSGTRDVSGVWHWQPPTERERAERRKLKAEALARGERFTIGCRLGPAGSKEARVRWAEVSGYADLKDTDGTLSELVRLWKKDPKGLPLQANGEPRSPSTIAMYTGDTLKVEAQFGGCRYAKTEDDVARGRALGTALIQTWADEHQRKGMLKREFAVLDNIFSFAIRRGRTTYNPCAEVVLGPGGVRDREPLEWEVECLRALARLRMALMIDFEGIVGWRIGDILNLVRAQGTADGVLVRYRKRGKRWLWEWSPKLRAIWLATEELPGATKFPASPVFPSKARVHLSYARFDAEWQDLKRTANALLASGIIDPDTLERHAGRSIENLHFHDLRSKAHDDAVERNISGNNFLGNSKAVARRHYHRRPQREKPLA